MNAMGQRSAERVLNINQESVPYSMDKERRMKRARRNESMKIPLETAGIKDCETIDDSPRRITHIVILVDSLRGRTVGGHRESRVRVIL
jgi:hypothetical protein